MEGGNKIEEPVVRDGEYYIDSADCVILVENTLFKVSDANSCTVLPPRRPGGCSYAP